MIEDPRPLWPPTNSLAVELRFSSPVRHSFSAPCHTSFAISATCHPAFLFLLQRNHRPFASSNSSGPAVVVTTSQGNSSLFLAAVSLPPLLSRCFLLCQSICVFSTSISLRLLRLPLHLRLRLRLRLVRQLLALLLPSLLLSISLSLSRSASISIPIIRILFQRRDSCHRHHLASPNQLVCDLFPYVPTELLRCFGCWNESLFWLRNHPVRWHQVFIALYVAGKIWPASRS